MLSYRIKQVVPLMFCLVVFLGMNAEEVLSEIHTWTDENGIKHYTNKPLAEKDKVPGRNIGTMDELEAPKAVGTPQGTSLPSRIPGRIPDIIEDDFEGGHLSGWETNPKLVRLEFRPSGGNPGGYIYATQQENLRTYVWVANKQKNYVGDYLAAGARKICVDLRFLSGRFNQMWLRMRYRDSRYNGWHYLLPGRFESDEWQTFCVGIGSYSDAEAKAAGWVREPRSASFVDTLKSVYSIDIRAVGCGRIELGIDNFRRE